MSQPCQVHLITGAGLFSVPENLHLAASRGTSKIDKGADRKVSSHAISCWLVAHGLVKAMTMIKVPGLLGLDGVWMGIGWGLDEGCMGVCLWCCSPSCTVQK